MPFNDLLPDQSDVVVFPSLVEVAVQVLAYVDVHDNLSGVVDDIFTSPSNEAPFTIAFKSTTGGLTKITVTVSFTTVPLIPVHVILKLYVLSAVTVLKLVPVDGLLPDQREDEVDTPSEVMIVDAVQLDVVLVDDQDKVTAGLVTVTLCCFNPFTLRLTVGEGTGGGDVTLTVVDTAGVVPPGPVQETPYV